MKQTNSTEKAKRIQRLEESARILGKLLKDNPRLSSNSSNLYGLAYLKKLGLAQI